MGEGEQVTLREPQVSIHRKNATSSAHIYGKPLVSAESFTFLSAPGYPEFLPVRGESGDHEDGA